MPASFAVHLAKYTEYGDRSNFLALLVERLLH